MWTCGHWFSIGTPALSITQKNGELNKVSLHCGEDSSVDIITSGTGLSLLINSNGQLEFKSNTLTTINTKFPIEYNIATNTVTHSTYKYSGSYGPSSNIEGTRTFKVPSFQVDNFGHIEFAEDYEVSVSLETKQLQEDEELHRLLLSSSNTDQDETGYAYKSNITYDGKVLTVPGQIAANNGIVVDNGNIEIKKGVFKGKFEGDVTGSATPKIHTSTKQDYGGASIYLYGHVKVQDSVPGVDPGASSANTDVTDVTNSGISAIAASPKMVYDALQQAKKYVDENEIDVSGYDSEETKVDISKEFEFGQDFVIDNKIVNLRWKELNN